LQPFWAWRLRAQADKLKACFPTADAGDLFTLFITLSRLHYLTEGTSAVQPSGFAAAKGLMLALDFEGSIELIMLNLLRAQPAQLGPAGAIVSRCVV